MTIFTCSDDFESILSCIYEAWSTAAKLGHSNLSLAIEPVLQPELFCDYIHVKKDSEKAQKVIRSIQKKISIYAYRQIYQAAMSCLEEKADVIYRFLILGFQMGKSVTDALQYPQVSRLFEINRSVSNEAHYFREFLRFSSVNDGVFISYIDPKSNVLSFLGENFSDRMPSENWMIIDERRHLAAVHPRDEPYYLTTLSDPEFHSLREASESPDPFVNLWKAFFQTIGIEARKNHACQRNHLPIWYRKNMTEFR